MPRRCIPLPLLALFAALTFAACREEGDIQITGLKFNGVTAVDAGDLQAVLQTKRGSRIPWGRKRYFDRRAFDADLKRIQAFYADRGFPDARVSSFDVKLNDTQDKVDIVVNIDEGEPMVVAEIDLQGFEVIPDRVRRRLPDTLPLQPGRPLDRQLQLATREQLRNGLRDHGYPYAEVTIKEEEFAPRSRKLVLVADPGPLSHFGPVEIAGVKSVGEDVVRRQLTFEPGERYRRPEIRNSQRKLYNLELFEFANIEPLLDTANKNPEVPTRVTVAEGKHQKLTFGVGYGTEEQARTRLRWDHVNFGGGARHAGFEGKWSSLDRGVKVDFTEPYLLRSNFSGRLDAQAWQAAEPVYSLNNVGGRFTLKHQATPQTTWSVSIADEFQRSTIANEALLDLTLRDELISLGLDPRRGESEGTLSAIAFDATHNTVDNMLDARRGYLLSAHVEQAGKWLWGTFNFWSITAEGRHYQRMGRRVVLANRLRVGSIDPFADFDGNVPFYRRFFVGGASSVRGWGRFEISPLSGFGLPIGGLSMLEGSSEVRLPVWGKLGAVGFLDYGNVGARPWDFDLSSIRFAVGPGLRYLTPVGPARIDLGLQLNPIDNLKVNGEPETRHWRVHFSIGQAF